MGKRGEGKKRVEGEGGGGRGVQQVLQVGLLTNL